MLLDVLIYSLIIGIFVGLSAGYLGSLMVLEKMALVGDALSHVALPGVALGFLYNFDPILGGFAFLFVSAVVIWHVGRVTKLSFETIVGAMFTLALAIGIIMFGNNLGPLEDALFGDITQVTLVDAVGAIAVSIVAVFLIRMIYRKIILGMISEELAVSQGVNVAQTNLVYLLLVSLVVAIGIKIVGTLLVGFLVVVPAAAAKNLSPNLFRYSFLSATFGAVSAASGVLLSGYTGLQAGPLIVLSGISIFIVTIITRWRIKTTI